MFSVADACYHSTGSGIGNELEVRTLMGRDGVPTDVPFLRALASVSEDLEARCGQVRAMVDASTPLIPPQSDSWLFINGVHGTLVAAARLRAFDKTIRECIRKRPNLMNDELHAKYASLSLLLTRRSRADKSVEINEVAVTEACSRLTTLERQFMQLCHKVNFYGYDAIKGIMLAQDADLAVRVDRAMWFYRFLLESTDSTYTRICAIPIIGAFLL